MPGVMISVKCTSCSWRAELHEGGFGNPFRLVWVTPQLCNACGEVTSVTRPHAGFPSEAEHGRCQACGSTDVGEWPGRNTDLLLDEAANTGELGACPRCAAAVERDPEGLSALLD